MTLFYKGVPSTSFWHSTDLRGNGIQARKPSQGESVKAIIEHIIRDTAKSPYVSVSKSYAVAVNYAQAAWTSTTAGYVYAIEVPDGSDIIDPVYEIADENKNPLASPSYHHDGGQDFLHGVADRVKFGHILTTAVPHLPPGTMLAPIESEQLHAMVFAQRDAEALIVRSVPKEWIKQRYSV